MIVNVKHVLTHADYDREAWKKDAKRPEKPERPAKGPTKTRAAQPGKKAARKKKR